MLLNNGELDGVRILSAATVRRMTTNSLPPGIRFAGFTSGGMGPPAGATMGLGFKIRSDATWSVVPGSVGSFTWGGVWGTYFWVDPAEQLIAIQLIHVEADNHNFGPFWAPFLNLTYNAFLVPDQGAPVSAIAPAAIDQAKLAGFPGTYRFGSYSSRDKQEQLASEFGGLGIELAKQNGLLKVVSPIQDTPAAKAGVMANDTITHLDDEATQGMTLNQARGKIRGPVNTEVRLRIVCKEKDEPIELTIVRAPLRAAATGANLQVAVKDGKVQIEASGALQVLDFEKGAPITVVPMSSNEFFVDGGDHTRLAFLSDGRARRLASCSIPGPGRSRVCGSTERVEKGTT
jgi:hypothetical protein